MRKLYDWFARPARSRAYNEGFIAGRRQGYEEGRAAFSFPDMERRDMLRIIGAMVAQRGSVVRVPWHLILDAASFTLHAERDCSSNDLVLAVTTTQKEFQ